MPPAPPLAHLRALGGDEARTEAVDAREVLVARRLVDLALGAKLGLQRLHGQAVRLGRAVAAAFADRVVDERTTSRVRIGAALAAAALFSGTGLVVDQNGDASGAAQVELDLVKLVAVEHRHAGRQHAAIAILLGFVGDHDELLRAFGQDLMGNLRHGQHTVDRLAAGHRDGIVEQDLVGDIRVGRNRRPDGEQPRMEIGPVAEIREHVLVVREVHLAGPRHAFAAHLAEGVGIAVHPQRHIVAADACERARTFGHAGRGIVRAARAEPRLAFHRDARLRRLALLRFDQRHARGNARPDLFGQVEAFQAPGDGLGDQRRRQFVVRGQQPVAARHRPLAAIVAALVELAVDLGPHVFAPVVQLFLERVFQDLALLFNHQDLFEAGRDRARAVRSSGHTQPTL